MGQHTWFYKSGEIYDEILGIDEKLEKLEESLGEEYFNSPEVTELQIKNDKLYNENETDFHDCFRTSKRESNKGYCLDKIYSKEECDKWLEENKDTLHFLNKECVDNFWEKNPNGVIDFG